MKIVKAISVDKMLRVFEDTLKDAGIESCTSVNAASSIVDTIDVDRLYEVIDKFNTSSPVSGDWKTETAEEQKVIADEFNISLEDAKQVMIEILGFAPDDDFIAACDSIEATTYLDQEGGMGERGAVYTEEELRTYFNENKGADPVLDQYDSFEDWLTDSMESGLKIQYDVDATDRDAQETEEIDEEHLEPVIGSYSDDDSIYEEIKHKQVQDVDGFYTDYTMYEDTLNGGYVFVFGDRDLYRPEDGDFDFECDTLQEAEDWFDDYVGFAEEGEDDLLYL